MVTRSGGDTDRVLVILDSKQIHTVISQLHDMCEKDTSFRTKLRGAASQAWLSDGQVSHLYDLESLVQVLAGVSVAGAMFEMNLRARLVDYDDEDVYEAGVGERVLARDSHPVTGLSGVVCVISGEYFWIPEWFLLMSGEQRAQHLRQAATLALMDHGLPRTGAIDNLPWLQVDDHSLSG